MSIYFVKTPEGQKAYKKYKKKYIIALEKKCKELFWDSEDPKYSSYSKNVINAHNEAVKAQLEKEMWGEDFEI